MLDSSDRLKRLQIQIDAAHPQLLKGLETWVQLGLLSQAEVLELCRTQLTCPLPEPVAAPVQSDEHMTGALAAAVQPDGSDFVPLLSESQQPQTAPAAPFKRRSSRKAAAETPPGSSPVQAFMTELSVAWLLFLGVFLVVVSSGVLAASQWRFMPPVGQYGILFAYTLVFWVAALWTRNRPTLRLTARMLRIATLLIIPVNFWMMDALQLWRGVLGLGVGAIATLLLTLALVSLLSLPRSFQPSPPSRLQIANGVGLSGLHWGWSWSGVPVLAVYVGMIGTALILVQQVRRAAQPAPAAGETLAAPPPPPMLSLETLLLPGMALLLVVRALLTAVPFSRLALALGICGWLLGWLVQPRSLSAQSEAAKSETPESAPQSIRPDPQEFWGWVGAGFLLVGWAAAIGGEGMGGGGVSGGAIAALGYHPPLQSLAISGLGSELLARRLAQQQRRRDLTLLFLIGLQGVWLLWLMVPPPLRQGLSATVATWGSDRALPVAIAGIFALPYLWLTVAAAYRFQQRQQLRLAHHLNLLTLLLGATLTALSLGNPLLRSLNLLLTTLTLLWVVQRQPQTPRWLVYLTHLTGVAAAIAWIRFGFPGLPDRVWAYLLLGGTVIEWSGCWGRGDHQWRHSAWHVGLGMAATSYWLLLGSVDANPWGLVWLVVPASLTLLTDRPRFKEPLLANWLSVTSVLLVQLLNLTLRGPWTLSLGLAAGLAGLNTARMTTLGQSWEAPAVAVVTIGFGLSFALALLRQWIDPLPEALVANLLAIAPLGLWGLWSLCRRRHSDLLQAYKLATDAWGIALSSIALVAFSLWALEAYWQSERLVLLRVLATGVLTLAIAFRLWQKPSDWGLWGMGWSVELLLAFAIGSIQPTVRNLAIATLGLALLTQLIGDFWVRRTGDRYQSGGHGVPLCLAGLGLLLGHTEFTATTGLYTLAAAGVGVGVGRRLPSLRWATVLSLGLASLAAYELLLYPLLQLEGGNPGDGVALLAGLAALLAAFYRLGDRLLLPLLQLRRQALRAIGHLHWGLGNALLWVALLATLSRQGNWLWLLIGTVLCLYALGMGNLRWSAEPLGPAVEPPQRLELPAEEVSLAGAAVSLELERSAVRSLASLWTYSGILELLVLVVFAAGRLLPDPRWLEGWWGAIATLLALPLYALPWQRWGWLRRPWYRAAIALPIATILVTAGGVRTESLLLAAAFYGWVAIARRRLRLSYFGVLLFDWALLRFLHRQGWLNPLWLGAIAGAALLYLIQIDPQFQGHDQREQRHWLRCFATAIVCLSGVYQSEVAIARPEMLGFSLLALAVCLGFVLAGLRLRVRAFLYIGTLVFVGLVLRQLWVFLATDSLLLWAVGIVLGLVLIWVAATFEARRSQVNTLVQHWLTALEDWQ